MRDFIKKIQIFIEKYHMIKKGGRVLAGVSGGADSVCLLLVLHEMEKTMGFSLTAVHVEHGIRGVESLADAVFAEKLCDGLGIPFRKFSVDALGYAEQTHRSVEEAARELRYDCFAQACAEMDADVVAVAHHANDNAETMLFHLARGTGIRGLGGIAPVVNYHVNESVRGAIKFAPVVDYSLGEDVRCAKDISLVADEQGEKKEEIGEDFSAGCQRNCGVENLQVIRPLLCVTRVEIEEYLNARGQEYRTDSTNADTTYTRNRIRGRILPELATVNAQAVSHMAQAAGQLREISEYLVEMALREGESAYKVVYRELPWQTEGTGDFSENLFLQADGAGMEGLLIDNIHIFSEVFLAMHRVLQSTLVHYLIGVIAGSEKNITSGHVEQVLELFAMREGRRTDLPYGISARRYADGMELYHRENIQGFQNVLRKSDGNQFAEKGSSGKSVLPGKEIMKGEFDRKSLLERDSDGNSISEAGGCLNLPVPGTLLLENGDGIRSEIMEFDGDFEKIPKKTYTKWMDYDKIKGNVLLRTRRPGDYLQIDAEGGRKKLKRYFIDEKIPADEREGTLLVADGSHVLWVIGHRISEACKVTNETRRVLCLEYFTEDNDGREN